AGEAAARGTRGLREALGRRGGAREEGRGGGEIPAASLPRARRSGRLARRKRGPRPSFDSQARESQETGCERTRKHGRRTTAECGGLAEPRFPSPIRCAHPRFSSLLATRPIGDSLLLTSGREGSTEIIMAKRVMVFDGPLLEVAVNNPGWHDAGRGGGADER